MFRGPIIEILGIPRVPSEGIVDALIKADALDEQAAKKVRKAFTQQAEAQAAKEQAQKEMKMEVTKLINRKKAVLCTSMNSFLRLYEKIIKINFTEGDGIKELSNFTPALAEETYGQIEVIGKIDDRSVTAKDVMVGFLTGGLLGAFTHSLECSIVNDAQNRLDMARLTAKEAGAKALHENTVSLACQAVTERVRRMTDILTKLNFLFYQGIEHTNEVLEKNGMDKNHYSAEERKGLASCINLAKAVKDVLDAPIIDEKGELTQRSMEAIENGKSHLEKIRSLI